MDGPSWTSAANVRPIRVVSRCSHSLWALSCLSEARSRSPQAIRPSHASAIDGSASVAATNSGNAATHPWPFLIVIARSKCRRAVSKSPIVSTILDIAAAVTAVATCVCHSVPQIPLATFYRPIDIVTGSRLT
ncbi:Uncharacterised protein [Mycobacterium tuberculosis]|uniref:Uncharacterized protein n=1 Tax=Mycobacterium tuberculosis TaxID=1773 RepID=A0A655F6B5_MYCTX|nr:Uncharacterised protein [Mycobacterium tuberculosis]CKO68613.1 Uncharacterised protein [Mycobacterium tuberculosis]CKQ12813.1 Uncharacterised protein [Mycobacterium tuberculosis]CKR32647.1 Uncharacterised protein [Mycobacterium tuberculosis]CKS38770.1 Uncharacterised protein [Mycobacterium tuberculosis]